MRIIRFNEMSWWWQTFIQSKKLLRRTEICAVTEFSEKRMDRDDCPCYTDFRSCIIVIVSGWCGGPREGKLLPNATRILFPFSLKKPFEEVELEQFVWCCESLRQLPRMDPRTVSGKWLIYKPMAVLAGAFCKKIKKWAESRTLTRYSLVVCN